MSVLDLYRPADFLNLLRASYWPTATLPAEAEQALRYYRGTRVQREATRPFQSLEARWYRSLAFGAPDYSVYAEPSMLAEMWACWVLYSRPYLRSLVKNTDLMAQLRHPYVIADLGNGLGLTTAALAEIFPSASVYGTNLRQTAQWEIASHLGSQYCFALYPAVTGPTDFIFASEYFEHIERPIEHLLDILTICRPQVLIIANAFGARSVGHFETYRHGTTQLPAPLIGRQFNKTLRQQGYTTVQTGFWNARPTYWRHHA